ncbi:MAG: caspase family protein [Acidobacteriaceae bacterium]|nr:caspase family protein [Acidobacteriaceae bacterium]MBV9764769.1 caspase family protein [Acidobacteriaceae bacterium]
MGDGVRSLVLLLGFALTAPAGSYYLTVAGLGGTPEYETQFAKWAADLDHELRANGPDATVVTLSGKSATRQAIQEALARIAEQVKPDDAFALMLIGHGTFDGTDYKFNIPGPDITAAELAALLNRIPARRQLVVNMTSCSGASLAGLAKKDRIVITATKSGNEKNATLFARYWIDALRDPAADTDKNGTVSALEAFQYAQHKTAAYFESEKLLATEHAQMSDSGKSNAVREPKPENGQGLLAAAFPILRPQIADSKLVAPEKQKLVARKEDLEAKIDRLKYQKAAMPADEYKQQLTALLLELAQTQAEIDR